MKIGNVVKLKNKSTVNAPGCPGLKWAEVMWGHSGITKCLKEDLVQI